MTKKRYQVSTTISPATWYQVHRLATEYGTIREVIARAVEMLDAEYWMRLDQEADHAEYHREQAGKHADRQARMQEEGKPWYPTNKRL